MKRLKISRRGFVHIVGILALIASFGANGQAHAAQTTVDVAVKIAADQNRVKQGQTITYTITTTNQGADVAIAVDVVHSLSDQLNVVSLTCDKGISPDGSFCEYSILEPGETVVSTMVATIKPDALNRERNVTTSARLAYEAADTIDTDDSNNTDAVTVRLVGDVNHH
jgi:uncharacterized repeat protein (TIGR01451 family)